MAELEGLRAEEARRGEALERQLDALAKQQFRAVQALHAAQVGRTAFCGMGCASGTSGGGRQDMARAPGSCLERLWWQCARRSSQSHGPSPQEEERRLGSELGGARAQGRNLSHRIAQLEEQLVHQQVGGVE